MLTVALADAILSGKSYESLIRQYYNRYPDAGYGGNFIKWARNLYPALCDSWGNGAAMRISPVGHACDTLEMVLKKAEENTAITHNHPEGIKEAQSTAAAIYLWRPGASKK